jgi:5-methylcytosine-specific restriction endonuclease McrA
MYVQCGSTKNLDLDHDIPFSRGGSSLTAANVRLLCAKRNLQNGVDGIGEIEGKVARVATSEFQIRQDSDNRFCLLPSSF